MSRQEPKGAGSLDQQLAQLPREVAPARDLWPEVLARLEAPAPRRAERRWLPLSLAAGVLLAVAAGVVGWQLGRERSWSDRMAMAFTGRDRAEAGFAVPASAAYLKTRATLERTYRERLELLAPATRFRIEQDLRTIRAANEDIRRALAADPQSAVLNRLLESTWQQEFDLYSTVVRNTEPAAGGNRT